MQDSEWQLHTTCASCASSSLRRQLPQFFRKLSDCLSYHFPLHCTVSRCATPYICTMWPVISFYILYCTVSRYRTACLCFMHLDEYTLHRVRSNTSWNSPFVTIVTQTWHSESFWSKITTCLTCANWFLKMKHFPVFHYWLWMFSFYFTHFLLYCIMGVFSFPFPISDPLLSI